MRRVLTIAFMAVILAAPAIASLSMESGDPIDGERSTDGTVETECGRAERFDFNDPFSNARCVDAMLADMPWWETPDW